MPPGRSPRVLRANRRTAVLTGSSLGCLSAIPTINLTTGCLHDCAYCYIRGYRQYPGESTAVLHEDVPDRVAAELDRRRRLPRAVVLSPSSDPFQPDEAILECTSRLLRVLFARGVGVSFTTKGRIPDEALDLLARHASLVRGQIGLISVDAAVVAALERGAAPAGERLAQMQALAGRGIDVRARVDPILPGVTDARDALDRLFAAIAGARMTRASVGTLFVRPAITAALAAVPGLLQPAVRAMLARYARAGRISMRRSGSSIRVLPAEDRRALIDGIRAAAAAHGIALQLCGCKHLDIASETCGIAGAWTGARPGQLPLRI